MDSDSSLDEERNRWNKQDKIPIRPNIADNNSDVSDEENISRAARSIESPPESPQGTHFESPPASPDPENKPGTPSPIQSPEDSASYGSPPRSPDSQAESRLMKNDSPPRSPDSYLDKSPRNSPFANRSPPAGDRSPRPFMNRSPPKSPQFGNRTPPSDHGSRSPTSNYPRSPSPVPNVSRNSPNSIQSPVHPSNPPSPSSIQSPTPESPSGIQSPLRSQSPNSSSPIIRSPSPYRSHRPSDSPSENRGGGSPRSPENKNQRIRRNSNLSDDGRSNISSGSSFGSPQRSPPRPRTPEEPPAPPRVKTAAELKSHVEDLSDVSDLESLNSMSDDEPDKVQCKENGDIKRTEVKKDISSLRNSTGLDGDDTEQLDFEAEEKEDGECETPAKAPPEPVAASAAGSEDEGELKGDELEEGEITDEGENRPEETEPRPICRFYNRGQCTWGASCRFVHPGVTDKGNYTMFEMVRPLVPVNGPPMGPPGMYGPPMEPYRPMERPMMGPPMYQQPMPPRKEDPGPMVESAWERGLRQAKEMLRKSSKRKETEVDFEEKKMNLSIGQDDLDKENDYYTRTASPVTEEPDRYGEPPKYYRTMSDRFDDYGGGPEGIYYPHRNTEQQVWHQRPHYDESMRGMYRSSKYYQRTSREKEYYSSSSNKKKYSQREVIVQRPEKSSSNWKEDTSPPSSRPSRYTERSGERGERSTSGRGDEWADPWMRSKTSPLSRNRSKKQSYSSNSSYSSSSSRSSSHSSSSSYSRSRSRSHSSRSRSRSKVKKMSPPRRLLRTSPLRAAKIQMPAPVLPEKKVAATMMNPPPPSPNPARLKAKLNVAANPSPPIERARPGLPTRVQKAASAVAAAMRSARSRSKSSRSSGSSDSSGSSSDSSESSFSSSSTASPPAVRQKRIVIDDRLALTQALKVKAMDALKLSGQKQQIKLTLKGSAPGERPPISATIAGKKRPAEGPPMDFSPPKVGGKATPKKAAPSRREELLKQLKAVEDAIARKRSKIS